SAARQGRGYFPHPSLPRLESRYDDRYWHEWCPAARHPLPEYVPDVVAGSPAPNQLTDWKIKAIKIAIIAETMGSVTRADFKAIAIAHRRWVAAGWLRPENGRYVRGDLPDFRAQHPRVYGEILADAEKWMPKGLVA